MSDEGSGNQDEGSEDQDEGFRNQRRTGIVTDGDKDWLDGDKKGNDQKLGLKHGMADMMEDIKYLFNTDLDNVSDPRMESLSELFDSVESDTEMTREECAKYLVSLAFIITNDPIDYASLTEEIEIHPRDDEESPNSKERAEKGAMLDLYRPVNELLSFHDALSEGIKLGKKRVDGDHDQPPSRVLIESNTKLYKAPTADRIDPNELDFGFSGEDWRDAFASYLDGGRAEKDLDSISRQQAIRYLMGEIDLSVQRELKSRQVRSNIKVVDDDVRFAD